MKSFRRLLCQSHFVGKQSEGHRDFAEHVQFVEEQGLELCGQKYYQMVQRVSVVRFVAVYQKRNDLRKME